MPLYDELPLASKLGKIVRKVIPNAFANGIEGIVVFPERITPLKAKSVKCNI